MDFGRADPFLPSKPCIGRFCHLIITTGDRPGVVPGCHTRVRVAKSVSGGHDAVAVGDPRPM